MPLITHFRYRPEIDGLRAVAVLAVVLYHAGLGVSGGYIGVDVFFVISGFLITSLIVKDLETGKFTLAHFWERRARRILPASSVLVLAVLAAGWFLLLPSDYANLGKSAAYQAAFGANFHFWFDTNYFAGVAEEQPLLHTWSLAVEEQFYLFFPLLLLGLFRFHVFRRRGVLLSLFICALLTSLAISIYAVPRTPAAAFYLLPTRAWELLCGAIIAILPASSVPVSRAMRETLTWLALTSILVPCFLYTKQTPFPGLAAVPSCLGTALFIWITADPTSSILHRQQIDPRVASPTILARLFSTRLCVFIGLISYSLYLWHWPIFAFSKIFILEPLPVATRLLMVALGAGLAILSWRYVETPFRRKTICSTRGAIARFAMAALGGASIIGLTIFNLDGVPARIPAKFRDFLALHPNDDLVFAHEMTATAAIDGQFVQIGQSGANQPCELLVWGDSHAMAAMPAFDILLKEYGISGIAATHSLRPPTLGYSNYPLEAIKQESIRFNDAVFAYIKKNNIQRTVLVAYWAAYAPSKNETLNQPQPIPSLDSYQSAILATVKRLVDAGCKPWIMLQVPRQRSDARKTLLRTLMLNEPFDDIGVEVGRYPCSLGSASYFRDQLTAAGAQIIDPRPEFFSEDKSHYINSKLGVSLYRDHDHLSNRGAKIILLPWLRTIFKDILPTQTASMSMRNDA